MSKLNQIQAALLQLSGGEFQKLTDTYLYRKGYEKINSLGSVVGADKVRKGTPDTLVELDNGKFAFVEHTTKQSNLYEKLESDLRKCFGGEKTGIPVAKIQEIVFCYTASLDPADKATLTKECQKQGVNVNFFSLERIAFDLYQQYPGLARDFLGVEVDTGQIVELDEFVKLYDKNRFAPLLNTDFHFREKELQHAQDALESYDIVILSGRAGVGKSRLALEACRGFGEKHPSRNIRCIYNRGVSLFEDVRVYFASEGSYLIFVDDAYRVQDLHHILQLLHDQRTDQSFKIILTVRDYAAEEIHRTTGEYGRQARIELGPLEPQQLVQLVEDEYGIKSSPYLIRIAEIADGNPRLAMMAAQVAKRENTLQSISNASTIYEEYFRSIREDLDNFRNQDLLKVASIIGFFRSVDKTDAEQVNRIAAAFDITPEEFWRLARYLYELEIVDMYEDEVVRFSDQVLSTYLFYLVFFKERLLNFSTLLDYFFPKHKDELIDAVDSALRAFDHEAIVLEMHPHIEEKWESLEQADEQDLLLHLVDTFWYVNMTDTLIFLKLRINELEQEVVDENTEAEASFSSSSILSILGRFSSSDEYRWIALELLFDYFAKKPSSLFEVSFVLTKLFGFDDTSQFQEFSVQKAVFDELQKRVSESEPFSALFLATAEYYLQTHFSIEERRGNIKYTSSGPLPSPELFALRRQIWEQLFQLFEDSAVQDSVLKFIDGYCDGHGHDDESQELIRFDSILVLPFLKTRLHSQNFYFYTVARKFLSLLDEYHIAYDDELWQYFYGHLYELSRVLQFNRFDLKEPDTSDEQFANLKREFMEAYFGDYKLEDFKQFISQTLEIQNHWRDHELMIGVGDVLGQLAKRSSELFRAVIVHYLRRGDPLIVEWKTGFTDWEDGWIFRLVRVLVKTCGREDALSLLQMHDYPTRRRWLFFFYMASALDKPLEQKEVEQLYALFRLTEPKDIANDLGWLLNHPSIDKRVVLTIAKMIAEKATSNSEYASSLKPITEKKEIEETISFFGDDTELLAKIYLLVEKFWRYHDDGGNLLSRILDLKPGFLLEYIDDTCRGRELNSQDEYLHQRDFSFLWLRDNYEQILTQVIEHIRGEGYTPFTSSAYSQLFFVSYSRDYTIRDRQNRFIGALIRQNSADADLMHGLFDATRNFSEKRYRDFLVLFLEHNSSFEVFKELSLEPEFLVFSDDRVPNLQKRISFLKSLLGELNTCEFLEHRQHVERNIWKLREKIKRERKAAFADGIS